jgi:hypothetical protein
VVETWVIIFIITTLFNIVRDISNMDQGEPGLDYDDPNLNPLVCDICNKSFDSLDKLGEHQKKEHDM